ncbi:APC family permease [Actinoplanes sp. NPDC023714]|uniref:APC family permease n=1 Tax=Actinoplanes sp. NPDC023714 TaxID=3154322 RepID=UPI0033D798AE
MTSGPRVLARFTLGPAALACTAVVASSPQTVLNGGIPATYAATGAAGVPLSFALLMAVIGFLAVGYVAVGRHVRHGAPFYAQLARGGNPVLGLVGAAVAFVGYNALQISLYPLLGTTIAALTGGGPWWLWALIGWLIVLLLGQYPGAVGAKVLGVLLALEITVVVLFIAAGFTHRTHGVEAGMVFAPSSLLVFGAAATLLVYAAAAFAGLETLLAYAEEAISHRALVIGTVVAISGCGVLYCLASWAYGAWVGFDKLRVAAADGARQPLALLGDVYGVGIADLATLLLVTSVLAAMCSFHATVARYVFALAREQVLPAGWAKVSPGARGGAPLGGTVVQSTTAAIVLGLFIAAGADPIRTIFSWLSTIGAVCVLLLLTCSSWAALNFFDKGHGGSEGFWVRQAFPFLGGILGVFVLLFMTSSLGTLLGTPSGSPLPWLVAVPIAAAIGVGVIAGLWLRAARPQVYALIGRGVPDGRTVKDPALEDVEV